ncbi:hypothetical protein MEQU1_001141 [Malassezia equina]|uniref:Eukaryotic translation initiation factor 3 subunit D n=1 Tax=Malassezia equina TaxID=1381935 RepID=A0AAF0ECH8_9BASI|nr:hypothetical protein MEQU1_001141 [Malassezia equina]
MATFSLPRVASSSDAWGPPAGASAALALPEEFHQIPFTPFSKSERIGRIADWNTGGAAADDRATTAPGRGARSSRSAPAPAYVSGTSSNAFTYFHGEDESSFSVVDNARSAAARRTTPGAATRGGRSAAPVGRAAVSAGRTGAGNAPARGARGARMPGANVRATRRPGWRDWERTQRKPREASITVGPDWEQLSELDFLRMSKLRLDVEAPQEVASYGTLYQYDRAYDRVSVKFERPLQPRDRVHYSPTTSEDPVIQEVASSDKKAQVYIIDAILALLMCAPRSVYPWDIVITKTEDNELFFDKRANSAFDFLTVNENASEPPMELNDPANGPSPENNVRAKINTPGALSLEATFVNENFGFQVCDEAKTFKFENSNPFHTGENAEEGKLASCGYRYRRFNLSTDEEDPVEMLVRTELNAYVGGPDKKAAPQLITIRTLNEFDPRAPGAGGAPDWRTRLDQSRGAVVATEMKNNSFKLARFTVQSILAGADNMKLGYISRSNPLDPYRHTILGTSWFKPRELAVQMAYNLANGWGIVRTIIDLARAQPAGRFVLAKDPNKQIVRFFRVPWNFEQEEEEEEPEEEEPEEDVVDEE